nr:MAG TPA: hypothetical protein [Caudoviricetes sp.]DAU87719.1 MAG TPA: hypothetical protein [Caudoviricetes sp.]
MFVMFCVYCKVKCIWYSNVAELGIIIADLGNML